MTHFLCFVVPAIAIFLIICARPSAASRAHERKLRDGEWREFEARVARAQAMTGELNIDRALELLDEFEESNANMKARFARAKRRTRRRNRMHYLEPMARNGDLIAFQEWKQLAEDDD